MRSRFDNSHSCGRWDKLRFQTNYSFPSDPEFERCPYCGDPLDSFEYISYVKLELDTKRFQKKRLNKFVKEVLPTWGEVVDTFKSDGFRTDYPKYTIYIVLLKIKGDGDKVAMSIQHYDEVYRAFDKRHERITLN